MRIHRWPLGVCLSLLLVGLTIWPVHAQLDAAEQAHKDTVRLIYDAFNQNSIDIIGTLYSPDYVSHTILEDVPGIQAYIDYLTELRNAMPDLQINIEALLAEDDLVFSRFTFTGTFQNDLNLTDQELILPPTGQPFLLTVHALNRFGEDGKIVENWELYDSLDFLTQVGVAFPVTVENPDTIPTPETDIAPIGEIQILQTNMEDANRAAALTFLEQMIGQGNVNAGSTLLLPEFVHSENGVQYNLEDWKVLISNYRVAMPDLLITPERTVAEGNIVAVYYTLDGTSSDYFILPDGSSLTPNGQLVKVSAMMLFHFSETGQIQRTWNVFDNLSFVIQIGGGIF